MQNESLLFIWDSWRRVCYCDPVVPYGSIRDLPQDVKALGTKPHISPSHMGVLIRRLKVLVVEEHSHFQPLMMNLLFCVRGRFTIPLRAYPSILPPTHISFPLRGEWFYFTVFYFKSTATIRAQASEFDPVDPEPVRRLVDDISKQLNLMVMMIRRSQIQKSYLNQGLSNCHITFEVPGTWGEERSMYYSSFI